MRDKAIARYEFDDLKRLVLKYRSDWPAVFSTNIHHEIWPFLQWGYTPGQNREPVRGLCKTLDEIADDFLKIRSGGGRFFIDPRGVFYKDESSRLVQVMHFRIYG